MAAKLQKSFLLSTASFLHHIDGMLCALLVDAFSGVIGEKFDPIRPIIDRVCLNLISNSSRDRGATKGNVLHCLLIC